MKLSTDKVDYLAEALVDQLAEIEGVLFQTDDARLRMAIREIMLDELQIEERLDAEIHKMLQARKYEITMGRMNYDELFKKIKNRFVAERRLIL